MACTGPAERRASIVDLQAAINRFLEETNDDPKPFVWTADPDKIIAAVRRGCKGNFGMCAAVGCGHVSGLGCAAS